jgi:protoheme IX farnesyltransferase
MANTESIYSSTLQRLKLKISDYVMLVKFRLSFIVVFSAGIGYMFGAGDIRFFSLFLVAGFLITAASNALNQVLEIQTDKLMTRTAKRPLPTGRMTSSEAILAAGVMGISGIVLMWIFFNPLAALIGALSLLSYAFVYTPFKKVSPIAVFIGAFPGAVPPLIGWAAATGSIAPIAVLLFSIQFIWQFPHFWAIAWLAHDDYKSAGFNLLPSPSGKTKSSSIHVVLYSLVLIPVSLIPYFMGYTGIISAIIVGITGVLFFAQSIGLHNSCSDKRARQLMFGSFLYLPIVLITLFADQIY